MLKIKDVIEKLQELNNDDYLVSLEIEPEINCYEQLNGDGFEAIKYRYTIILEQKNATIEKYINKHGIKEYVREKLEKQE